MTKLKNKGFSLIELLVVITILAIISVVAYTNFSGSTDKAKNSKKISDLASIETALQTYYSNKNYYPMPQAYDATKHVWGYSTGSVALTGNTLVVTKNGADIASVTSGTGGGYVKDIGGANFIGVKGTITSSLMGKEYLSTNLLDPALKDIKVGTTGNVFGDYGVGEYVYGVYAKPSTTVAGWNSTLQEASAYNLAVTLNHEVKGKITKLIGNFDSKTCTNCPRSLIGPGLTATDNNLDEGYTGSLVPYPLNF